MQNSLQNFNKNVFAQFGQEEQGVTTLIEGILILGRLFTCSKSTIECKVCSNLIKTPERLQ